MTLSLHTTPGTPAAFDFQFERALYWLAKSPAGSVTGIETDDDVAIRGGDGSRVLEQDKHSIQQTSKPFGDRSHDLWNTLAIWIDALDNNEVQGSSIHFLMVTNKSVPDCIAHQIGRASTDDEITACITALEAASQKPTKELTGLMQSVLKPASRANLCTLIRNCDFADASASTSEADLRKETIAHLQLPAWAATHANSIADELLGWLHSTALALWQKGEPCWIQRNHFVNQLHAILDRRKREIARERSEHLIPVSDAKVGENKGSRFVRQLHLVTEDDTIVDNAIREFIRCNIEKSRLSEEGNITDDDWTAFETVLLSRWSKIRARVLRMKEGTLEEDIGFEIFTETTEDHREPLAGSDTEQVYITSGTYHRLADLIRVGWHPRFEELMQKFIRSQ
jgi:hypothetical protein